MKVVTIMGARPQFVKAAMVSRALRVAGSIREVLVHTGQHFDANMSDVFFNELEISLPAYNLGIGGGRHGENTGRMIEAIEKVLLDENPDWVLVFGDTDSTLAAAIVAAKLLIPLVHVEAGLRSFNRAMPEEINRILTDHCSALLIAPSETAVANLKQEGIAGPHVQLVGDVMYDAALHFARRANERTSILEILGLTRGSYVLCTAHRKENVDHAEKLAGIFSGLSSSRRSVILPLHPRTRGSLTAFGINIPDNVRIIDPVGYLDMIVLESNAAVIVTDSGGIQKEAFFHGVPCVTLREETEWVELVEAGVNQLVGTDPGAIASALDAPCDRALFDVDLYGAGMAAERIAQLLLDGPLEGARGGAAA